MPFVRMSEIGDEDLLKIRRWISAYREGQLTKAELEEMILSCGYDSHDVARYIALIASTDG